MGRFPTVAALVVLLGSFPLAGSACSANGVTAGTGAAVATVTVNGLVEPLPVGATRQLTVVLRDADGNAVATRPVAWRSADTQVATVDPATGVVTGVAAGSTTITATYAGIEGRAPVTVGETSGAPDPTLLPAATGQTPVAGSYGRALNAGQTYQDPNTNATVLKVTDARTPAANTGMYHGYSEGGPLISQRWQGTDGGSYYTLWLAQGDGWFVDVRYPQLTLSNWRQAPRSGETVGAWSLDPATPRIFYYVSGGNTVNRYDTQTMALANTGRFPWVVASSVGSNLLWLQTQLGDTWLVAMASSNNTVVGWRRSDGLQRAITGAAYGVTIDEPHIDREQPVVYLSIDNGAPNKIVNLATGAATNPVDPNSWINDDHNAPMRGKIVGVSWQANATVAVDWQGRVTKVPGISPTNWNGDYHMAGQWVFDNPKEYFAVDQWQTAGGAWPVKLGMIGLQSMSGDVRLLAAHDAVGGGYQTGGQPHITLAPDGRLLMWTSNMNRSARFDVFLAKLPAR